MTPEHAPLLFEIRHGEIHVGGEAVTTLAERHGTPFYAYDAGLIRARIAELRQVLPPRVQVHYAIKANPFPPLLKLLADRVDGADVASAAELGWAIHAGFAPEGISFAGPGKRDEELLAALQAGITLHVESAGELERLVRLGEQSGIRPRLALRINPPFELKGSGMRMGGGAKPFGIDFEQAPSLISKIKHLNVDFAGLHIFPGSQSLNSDAIVQAQRESLNMARQLLENAAPSFQSINIGGGLGIPYFPGEKRIDINKIGYNLHAIVEKNASWLGQADLILELGRFLVGEAGIYVTRVIERKTSRGEVFLITDGGMHHHLALSGNLGQILRKNYPVYHATRMDARPEETVHIHGPLCTPLDVLAQNIALPRAQVGDLIAIAQSGAYGLTASPVYFLGHPPAKEVLVDAGHE